MRHQGQGSQQSPASNNSELCECTRDYPSPANLGCAAQIVKTNSDSSNIS
jgi:hypothetical protein